MDGAINGGTWVVISMPMDSLTPVYLLEGLWWTHSSVWINDVINMKKSAFHVPEAEVHLRYDLSLSLSLSLTQASPPAVSAAAAAAGRAPLTSHGSTAGLPSLPTAAAASFAHCYSSLSLLS